ncbi:MAG: DUF1192 domain-containing protein [Rhodospirillaceae bacterium]|nr:DUF1192 domain-containing protein [Rhodospirillaceae bacterium]
MDDDDWVKPQAAPAQKNLEPLSVAELNAYIDALTAEIARAKAAIDAKRHVRAGADSLFRS